MSNDMPGGPMYQHPMYQQPMYPQQPPAAPKKSANCLIWGLATCGIVGVVLVILAVIGVNKFGKNVQGMAGGASSATQKIMTVRTAINDYKQAHKGKYPAALKDILDADTYSYTKSDGQTVTVEYKPPKPDDADDVIVARYFSSEIDVPVIDQQQKIYICLLKDGSLIQEQDARTPLRIK